MYQVLTRLRTFYAFCEDLIIFIKLTYFTFKLRVKIIRILLQLIKNGQKNSPIFCCHKVTWLCDQRHDSTVIKKKTVFKKSWKKPLIGTKKTPRKPRFALKVMRKPSRSIILLDILCEFKVQINQRFVTVDISQTSIGNKDYKRLNSLLKFVLFYLLRKQKLSICLVKKKQM